MSGKIAVCSLFRNNVFWFSREIGQVKRYADQMRLQTYGIENLDFYLLEGDSSDGTFDALNDAFRQEPLTDRLKCLLKYDLGTPYKSDTSDERLAALSKMDNFLLSHIDYDLYQWILWIESDLVIPLTLIADLVNTSLSMADPNIIAPYISLYTHKQLFYDTFLFKSPNGENWPPSMKPHQGITLMSSVGSCALITAKHFKDYRINFGTTAFFGLCQQARNAGYRIYADTNIVISHPSTRIENRWV